MLFGIRCQILLEIAARNLVPVNPIGVQINFMLGILILAAFFLRASHQKLPCGNQHPIRRLFGLG
jgi:hypothetical protein